MTKESLDLKDKKILYQLDLDSKQSSARIAKKVGLSKDAVNYRINRLKNRKIIKHFYTVLNTPQLGFMHFNTLFRFRNITNKIKKEFIEFCQKNNQIIWCVSCYGSWDFSVSFLAKSLDEYNKFTQEILNLFGRNIHEKSMSLMIDSPTFTREYLINSKQGKEFQYKISGKSNLDQTEHFILALISQKADLTAIEIGNKLKLTPDVVRYRLKQLQEKKIIQGFRIAIDLDKIGYLYYKLLFNLKDLTIEREREFREYCKRNANVVQFIKYLGNWEIQIEIEVPSEDKLFEIIEHIRNKFNDIIKTYEILRLKEEKLDYYPLG
jgi:Lrp/AsnC family transcriptional regulator, leucine-responsive regulatory protein